MAAAVFSLFSYLQFNDFEQYGTSLWYAWALAYGATATLALISAWHALPRVPNIGCAAAALVAAVIRAFAIDWSTAILYNEGNPAGNEASGLIIVALWFAFLAIEPARKTQTTMESANR